MFALVTRGACQHVTAATATLNGMTATLRIVVGAPPKWNGFCTANLEASGVLIRLPAPAPLGVRFR